MALPTKLYADVDKTIGTNPAGFKFITRDPAAEMEYTAKTLNEIMGTAGYWAQAETNVGTVLTSRYEAAENKLWQGTALANSGMNPRFAAFRDALATNIGLTNNQNVALEQYYLGLSAAFGGGHTNVGDFMNIATQDRRLQVTETSIKAVQALSAITYGAASAMPLVVPVESQLIADACSSAVETYYLGEIRAQQIRQTKAAGAILSAIAPSAGTNPTPIDEVVMFGSIQAQGAAAAQT